jgi:hypothetical protein
MMQESPHISTNQYHAKAILELEPQEHLRSAWVTASIPNYWYISVKHCQKTTFTNVNEASCSEYVSPFLVAAATLLGGRVKLCSGFYIEGKYGCRPLDFCLRFLETIIGVVEVKNSAIQLGNGPNTHANPHITRDQPEAQEF